MSMTLALVLTFTAVGVLAFAFSIANQALREAANANGRVSLQQSELNDLRLRLDAIEKREARRQSATGTA